MGIKKVLVIKRNIPDNVELVSNDTEFISIKEMPLISPAEWLVAAWEGMELQAAL